MRNNRIFIENESKRKDCIKGQEVYLRRKMERVMLTWSKELLKYLIMAKSNPSPLISQKTETHIEAFTLRNA